MSIGGQGGIDISKYLQNFSNNNAQWASQANNYLQSALNNGLQYSQNYSQAAIKQMQSYNNQANQMLRAGYQQAMALDAPQRRATQMALNEYMGTLGMQPPKQVTPPVAPPVRQGLFPQPPQEGVPAW